MTDPKNKKKTITDKGKYLTVYTKQADGSWKAIADTYNSDSAK
jgi:ketosteroid isomerase-like protein